MPGDLGITYQVASSEDAGSLGSGEGEAAKTPRATRIKPSVHRSIGSSVHRFIY